MDKEYERKCIELAYLIFPDVNETVDDLEIRYKERNLKEGAAVTRYAPSPTGFLHTGSLFTTLVDMKIAEQTGGIFYLRVEDTDQKREVKGSIESLTKELKEFGLVPQEGVITADKEIGDYGPYTQSKRAEIYRICAKHLIEKGLAYPCFCTPEMNAKTREAQEANKVLPGYYGVYAKCRNISIDESIKRVKAGEKYILRFRSQGSHLRKTSFIDAARGKIEIAENDQDIVLIKADGLPTYHFAHVVDDHFMRTTHVVRGEEWIPSTPIHIELFNAMGFEAPIYVHVPLLLVKDGNSKRKLSKRKDKEAAVSYYLKAGYPTEAVMEYLYTLVNSDYEIWRKKNKDLPRDSFDIKLNKMSSSGSLLDIMKLNDISREYISKMTSREVLDNVLAWSKKYDVEFYDILNRDLDYSLKIFGLERDNATKIRKDIIKWEDVRDNFFYFFNDLYEDSITKGYEFDYETDPQNSRVGRDLAKNVLERYLEVYNENDDKDTWFANVKALAGEMGFCTDMKFYKQNKDKYVGSISDFASIIRVAITNKKNTPDIHSIMKLLGKGEVINRIEMTIKNM